MKTKIISAITILLIIAGAFYIKFDLSCKADSSQKEPLQVQSLWMDYQRSYPHKGIKPEHQREAMKQAKLIHNQSQRNDYTWEDAGPFNIGGRITDLEYNPDNIDEIYVGGATGGIFKSVNGGSDWNQIFNEANTISIGDLAIDPNNPETIYAGTGEANSSSYSFLGDGIYKSTDGGETWNHSGLEESAYIGRIIVDHENSNRVYVAACGDLFSWGGERGIYRSVNGGEDWENVLFVNDSTSGIDLVQHPENANVLYAAMWERRRGLNYRNSFGDGSGIYKTTNGGNTWTELSSSLPTGSNVGRIGLTIAESNPDVLYAFYDMPSQQVRVYKTTDGGQSWTRTNDGNLSGMNSSFGWYFGQIRVNPDDENTVYALGVEMYRTTNGGNSWEVIADYSSYDIHVDHHAMFFDKNTGRIYEGNDGGFYYSDDEGDSWTKINNLPLTQFYFIEIDYQLPDRLVGGTQDNNTIMTWSGGLDDWFPILGGDGFYCLVDYDNNNNVYAEYQWGGLCKATDGGYDFSYIASNMSGDRNNWMAPLAMDPEDPQTLYFGTHRIWKSTNGGWNWSAVSGDLTKGGSGSFHTLTTIAVSPLNRNVVVCGSADGKVHISTTFGSNWSDISTGLPDRWITRVACDPFNENKIFATVSGFRWDEPQPHVFVSDDLGQNWTDISSNLPDLPVNIIVCDPEFPGRLFIGTDAGIFYTEDEGESWESFNFNIPNVAVVAIDLHNPTRTLIAGTYGLSAYRFNLGQLVGINEKELSENKINIKVTPNPVSLSRNFEITIKTPQWSEIDNIEIYTLNGKRIIDTTPVDITGNCYKIKINDLKFKSLKPGAYLLRVSDETHSGSTKIIFTP